MTTKLSKLLGCFCRKKPSKPFFLKQTSTKPQTEKIAPTPVKENTCSRSITPKAKQKIVEQGNFFEVKSPIPSIQNYPEDDNPEWLIGIDNQGERVKVPEKGESVKLEYALGWRTSETAVNFDNGDPAYFNAFESNTTKITSPGGNYYQITLSSGYVYKLIGFVSILESPPSRLYRGIRWYNVSTGSYFGSQGGFVNGTDASYSGGGSGGAIAYIKPTSTQTFELRCSASSVDSDYIEYGTSFNVEVMNATSL